MSAISSVVTPQIPLIITTPAEITELLIIGREIINNNKSNIEDIKKLLKLAEDLFNLISLNPNLKITHLTYVNKLIEIIYCKINQLSIDDIKRRLSTKLEYNQETIKILIKLIEFSLKNEIDIDIEKYNRLVVSIIKKYYLKDANANLKKLFDISINLSRFNCAEFYLRNMTLEPFDVTCLASSICLSKHLNKNGFYFKARKILMISKQVIDFYLRPAEYTLHS
jgi:hypothetical protein